MGFWCSRLHNPTATVTFSMLQAILIKGRKAAETRFLDRRKEWNPNGPSWRLIWTSLSTKLLNYIFWSLKLSLFVKWTFLGVFYSSSIFHDPDVKFNWGMGSQIGSLIWSHIIKSNGFHWFLIQSNRINEVEKNPFTFIFCNCIY